MRNVFDAEMIAVARVPIHWYLFRYLFGNKIHDSASVWILNQCAEL